MKHDVQKNKIYWGLRPTATGAYCNINMETGNINYLPPPNLAVSAQSLRRSSSFSVAGAMRSYGKLDKVVQKTLDDFAKFDLPLFNALIND
jgi:hypothetical protein